MKRHLHVLGSLISASAQQELAYRANFAIGLLHSLLNVATGWLGLAVVFGQVETLRGWDFAAALAVLGVYLVVAALRDLVISPSLDALAGLEGEIWRGGFDFVLLRPINTQFLVSLRRWRLFALVDLALALAVLAAAVARRPTPLTWPEGAAFALALAVSVATVYAVFLAFTSLMFFSPGFLFTWVFNGVFQMARYPVGIYPGVFRLLLTWLIPLGIMTTVPAQALAGGLTVQVLFGALLYAAVAFAGASALFRAALRRYASASS